MPTQNGIEPIPKTMRAAVYRGVNDLRMETLPVPRIGSMELLVKVAVSGVCPTDIKKIQYGTVPPPRIFGHETAGMIVRVGARVRSFRVGERVGLHHHIPCLKCHACRHRSFAQCAVYKRTGITAGFEPAGGGFAEYVRVMPFVFPGIVRIPEKNSFLEGAMLEPVNTVLKAVHRLNIQPGDFVMVVGQGPIGLMFSRVLNLRRMNVVACDLVPRRLRIARQFGASWAFQADEMGFLERVERLTQGRGLDAAVIAVPSDQAVRSAQRLVRGGGQVLLFAHTRRGNDCGLDLSEICAEEKDMVGSYSADVTLQREAAELVFSGELDITKLVTNQFSLEATAAAIRLAAQPQPNSLKVVVSQHV